MQAHTTTQSRPWPDAVPPLTALALWLLPVDVETQRSVLLVLSAWLVVRYAATLTRIISGWRRHWVWKNESPATVP